MKNDRAKIWAKFGGKCCYFCKYFKGYDTINENVECSLNGVVHFECNQTRICDDYWED